MSNNIPYEIRQAIYKGQRLNMYVSTEGEVFDKNMKPKNIFHNKAGYPIVYYHFGNRSHISVHVLIAETFIPNPDNLETVNHKYGNKDDNRVESLEWMSSSDNSKHAHIHGLTRHLKCQDHQNATFTNEQVHSICRLLENNVGYDDIISILKLEGDIYEVRRKLIMIKNGYSWTDISSMYTFPKSTMHKTNTFNDEQVHKICKLMENNILDYTLIAKELGVDDTLHFRHSVSAIRSGKTYKKISCNYKIPPHNRIKRSEEDIRHICELIQEFPYYSSTQILALLGYEKNEMTLAKRYAIYDIKNRKTYTNISKDYVW